MLGLSIIAFRLKSYILSFGSFLREDLIKFTPLQLPSPWLFFDAEIASGGTGHVETSAFMGLGRIDKQHAGLLPRPQTKRPDHAHPAARHVWPPFAAFILPINWPMKASPKQRDHLPCSVMASRRKQFNLYYRS